MQTPTEQAFKIDTTDFDTELKKPPATRSVINLVDLLLNKAYEAGTSDIHLDPEEKALRARFRIDGILQDVYRFPKDVHNEVITRIKVLSGLRTDEHQATQDGRLRFKGNDNKFVDVRVAIAPTYYGENCVMRLLSDHSGDFDLKKLGFSDLNLQRVHEAMTKPHGLILTTGPTGSGKTTTLYMILKELNKPEISIVTIEDPIEYSLPGVDQIQVNRRTGLLFSTGLRSILRQDPNIVMVGEIRDGETATIAVNAAMTGHLVLSTLHTNNSAVTIPRLLDLGVEPFLIATTINIAIAQRLVRTICNDCKVKRILSEAELESLKKSVPSAYLGENKVFYKGEGCARCGGTGYKGRVGIHEVMVMDEMLRELVMKRANADEIRKASIQAGMKTMLQDGIEKAAKGMTTIEEVLRVFHE